MLHSLFKIFTSLSASRGTFLHTTWLRFQLRRPPNHDWTALAKKKKLVFSAGHRSDSAADQCLVNIDDRCPLILLPKLCGKRCGKILLVKNSQ